MAQKLTILGSTGSIGTQALDVVTKRGYEVVALTASTNVAEIEKQIRQYKPKFAAMADEKAAAELKLAVADTDANLHRLVPDAAVDFHARRAGYGAEFL